MGGTSGVPIKWKPAGETGEQWCVIQLGAGAAASVGPLKFQILTPVDAATWDNETGELEPAYFKARLLVPGVFGEGDPDEGEYTGKFKPKPNEPVYVRGVSYLPDAVNVTEGSFRVGMGIRVSGPPWDSEPFYVVEDFDEENWETFKVEVELFNVSCSERDIEEGA
jgi:hypothetical protein